MEKVKIERLDNFGRGIGYINNKIVFIENALPEEIVECEIIEDKKNYCVGKVVEYIKQAQERAVPKCKYYDKCGGCHLQHLSYEDTKNYKINKIKNMLQRENVYNGDINFIENKNDYYYRNKIELKIENNNIGFYKNKTHDLVSINECLITKSCINKIIPKLLECNLSNAGVTIRANYNDEILLIIDTNDEFKYEKLLENNKIVGIVLNDKLIYGESYFVEKINDMYFKVSYDAFFQINEYICSRLFEIIDNNIKNNSIVADLYCGVGTLSLVAAKKADKVYGIEIVENAILDAIKNAKINNFDNAYFMVGSVPNILPKINDKLDLVIVDPPRAGLDKKTLDKIIEYKPASIIYTSCDPMTLVRDLKELTKYYDIKEFNLLDMFSYTYHVESVVVLRSK